MCPINYPFLGLIITPCKMGCSSSKQLIQLINLYSFDHLPHVPGLCSDIFFPVVKYYFPFHFLPLSFFLLLLNSFQKSQKQGKTRFQVDPIGLQILHQLFVQRYPYQGLPHPGGRVVFSYLQAVRQCLPSPCAGMKVVIPQQSLHVLKVGNSLSLLLNVFW